MLAGEREDIVIVTNEDPYDDDPKMIINQVAAGARQAGKKDGLDLFLIDDRGMAIAKAIAVAQAGDVVLITGKGAETIMAVAGGKMIPWDDRSVARDLLEQRKNHV
jgi:UDP-N-acetylmuramoyl-L-alanyl-D-glutamate--2,6-diaminopimelate ligase